MCRALLPVRICCPVWLQFPESVTYHLVPCVYLNVQRDILHIWVYILYSTISATIGLPEFQIAHDLPVCLSISHHKYTVRALHG